MTIFREVREAIRRLPRGHCFGLPGCVMMTADKGALAMYRSVWFATTNGQYKGKEYQRIDYPITNWRKRLAILTRHQYFWLNGCPKRAYE